jgi:hypothetical protein
MQIVRAMLLVRAPLLRAKPIQVGRVVALRRAGNGVEPLGNPALHGFEQAAGLQQTGPREAGLQEAGLQEAGLREAGLREAGLAATAAALPFGVSLVESRITGKPSRDVMPGAAQISSAEANPGQSERPERRLLCVTSFAKPEPLPPSKE